MEFNKYFETVDQLSPAFHTILKEICDMESPTENKDAVDRCGQYFIDFAKERKWRIETEKMEHAGDPICITMNPDSALSPVVFSAHLDTVHPIGSFGATPSHIEGDKIYGPGASDCKGGAVCALLAMEALHRCGFKSRPIKLILQTDEETGSKTSGLKTVRFMKRNSKNACAFINLEGNSDDKTCILLRKGIHRFRYHIRGKAVHSAKCYNGANAVTEASYKIIELESLKDPNGITCNCGVIHGGTVANSVAEDCTFYADIRFLTEEEHKNVLEKVKSVGEKKHVNGCTCIVEEVSFRPSMPESEKNLNLLRQTNECFAAAGLSPITWKMSNGGSDASYMTQFGIPSLDNLGIVGGEIHSVREYAYLPSMALSAKRLIAIAANLCGE